MENEIKIIPPKSWGDAFYENHMDLLRDYFELD